MLEITRNSNIMQIYSKYSSTDKNKVDEQPVVSVPQSKYGKNNLITKYLDALAVQNRPLKQSWDPKFTPAGFGGFENMVVKDTRGNIVQEVKFSKQGTKIIETVNVNSVDGSKLNKTMTQDGNKKTMTINIQDKSGTPLIKEERTYEKLNDDTAISTHNGQEYKISGLKGNVITIEHNGQKQVVDFNKMVFPTTEKLNQSPTGNNITDEQKDFLISRFKNRPGDIILTVAKEIDKLTFMDENGYEGWYVGYADNPPEERNNGIRIVKTCKKADNMLELHELGHGVNEFNDKSGNCWSDLNKDYQAVREKEINNFHNNTISKDYKSFMQKFTNGEHMLKFGMTKEECKKVGANEEFAETYGFFNNMDIENIAFRTTSLIQNMPESVRMAFNASKDI